MDRPGGLRNREISVSESKFLVSSSSVFTIFEAQNLKCSSLMSVFETILVPLELHPLKTRILRESFFRRPWQWSWCDRSRGSSAWLWNFFRWTWRIFSQLEALRLELHQHSYALIPSGVSYYKSTPTTKFRYPSNSDSAQIALTRSLAVLPTIYLIAYLALALHSQCSDLWKYQSI